jgi:hypothetical protein
MTNSPTATTADVWRVAATGARLAISPLSGEVSLTDPAAGIGRLAWRGVPLVGQVLGVSAGASSAPQDAFSRGADLVAVYSQTEPQHFIWQVYWRVSVPEADVVLLDMILSLQTPLLKSFPRVTTHSQLPAGEASVVSSAGDCVLLRPEEGEWSYAEMTHPKDRGQWQLSSTANDQLRLDRHLGGHFLEKGVIRRLRLRGAFLPRQNDLDLAARYFALLAEETPPLTA